jgi:anti-sigma factor RsiW
MSPRDDRDPVTPALSRWLDGRSRPGEAEAIEARRASDPRFAAEVARLKAAADALRADRRSRPPEALGDRVLAEVARRDGEAHRFERLARRYAVAAAALLGVGVAGFAATGGASPAAPPGLDALAALEADRLAGEAQLEFVSLVADDLGRGGR